VSHALTTTFDVQDQWLCSVFSVPSVIGFKSKATEFTERRHRDRSVSLLGSTLYCAALAEIEMYSCCVEPLLTCGLLTRAPAHLAFCEFCVFRGWFLREPPKAQKTRKEHGTRSLFSIIHWRKPHSIFSSQRTRRKIADLSILDCVS